MTILTPAGRVDTAPTPTCDCLHEGILCGEPAIFVFGVKRTCGCPSRSRGFACDECATHPSGWCRFCEQFGVVILVEPVRLRGAASDGRTE